MPFNRQGRNTVDTITDQTRIIKTDKGIVKERTLVTHELLRDSYDQKIALSEAIIAIEQQKIIEARAEKEIVNDLAEVAEAELINNEE